MNEKNNNGSLQSVHLLQNPPCLLGYQLDLLVLVLLVFQVLHDLREDHEDPLFLEHQEVQALQLVPSR